MTDRSPRADAQENRVKILGAARSAFEELGPDANLREIARRSGLAQGTVHRHFPTKEALFATVITDHFRELAHLARQLRADRAAGDAFFAFLDAIVELARHNRSLSFVFRGSGGHVPPSASGEMGTEVDRLLCQAQHAGIVRTDIDLSDVHAVTLAALAIDAHATTHDGNRAKRIAIILDGLRIPA